MRLTDWSLRLSNIVNDARQKHFEYGTFDCALFAADCVNAMTGRDYSETLRGYHSRLDAYRIVASYGSLEGMIIQLLNIQPKHIAQATVGDVVLGSPDLMPDEQGEAIGICLGINFAFPAQNGLRMLPMNICRLAWSIE